ncbi:MAG: hypothetical protein AB7W47_12180 [Calditrichaceae bacterium]
MNIKSTDIKGIAEVVATIASVVIIISDIIDHSASKEKDSAAEEVSD